MIGQFSLFDIAPSIEGIDPRKAAASYSADTIATSGTVRKPVQHGGALWVSVGAAGAAVGNITAKLYRLTPAREWDGETLTYNEKSGYWREGDKYPGDFARSDPNGFYHGMRVKSGRETYVLTGPAQILHGTGADFGYLDAIGDDDEDDGGRTRIGNTPDDGDDDDGEDDDDAGELCAGCGVDLAQVDEYFGCSYDGGSYCEPCHSTHKASCPTCADAVEDTDKCRTCGAEIPAGDGLCAKCNKKELAEVAA